METMATYHHTDDDGPAERFSRGVVWAFILAGCLLFWALILYGLIEALS